MYYKIIMILIWMIIIPSLIGFFVKKNYNSSNSCCNYTCFYFGFFIELSLFEIISTFYSYYNKTLLDLKKIWIIINITLLIILILNFLILFKIKNNSNNKTIKNKKNEINNSRINIERIVLNLLLFTIISFQCYFSLNYMHLDADDSNFAAKATIAVDTNTLFKYDDLGNEYKELPKRHFFSQFPHYGAVISSICEIRPTILLHNVYPLIFIIMMYGIYYLIGFSLFKNNKNKALVFVIIMALIYTFGNYTRYAPYIRIFTRAWQGKTILVNIVIPFVLYLFLEYLGKDKDIFYWFLLMVTNLGGILLTSNSLYMLPLISGILTLILTILEKNWLLPIKYLISIIPVCIILISYIFMFGGVS